MTQAQPAQALHEDELSAASGQPGLRESLSHFGETFVSAVETRVQLGMLEMESELGRAEKRLILGITMGAALSFALLAAQALLVAALWERMGYRSLAVLGLLWLLVAIIAWMLFNKASLRTEAAFAATKATLQRDRDMLFRRVHR